MGFPLCVCKGVFWSTTKRGNPCYKFDHRSCLNLSKVLKALLTRTTFPLSSFTRTLAPTCSWLQPRGNAHLWGITHCKSFTLNFFRSSQNAGVNKQRVTFNYADYLCVSLLCDCLDECEFICYDISVMEHCFLLRIPNHLNQDWQGVAADSKLMADKETGSVSCLIKRLPPGKREQRPQCEHQMSLPPINRKIFPRTCIPPFSSCVCLHGCWNDLSV